MESMSTRDHSNELLDGEAEGRTRPPSYLEGVEADETPTRSTDEAREDHEEVAVVQGHGS